MLYGLKSATCRGVPPCAPEPPSGGMRRYVFISDDNNAADAGGRVSKLRECATRRNLSNFNKIYQSVFQYFVCLICFDFV